MGKYYIKSHHDIFKDTYQEGLGKHTNNYEMNSIITAENPTEAVEKYGKQVLGYDYDSTDICVEDGIIFCDILVNEDCMEATAEQIRLWEKGEYELFNDSIIFQIYSMEPLTNLE